MHQGMPAKKRLLPLCRKALSGKERCIKSHTSSARARRGNKRVLRGCNATKETMFNNDGIKPIQPSPAYFCSDSLPEQTWGLDI